LQGNAQPNVAAFRFTGYAPPKRGNDWKNHRRGKDYGSEIMIRFNHLALTAVAVIGLAAPASAQQAGGGPAPGTGNGVAIAAGNQDENASYNRVIGKVGADPVGKEKAKRAASRRPVPATAADVVPGAIVRDAKGVNLGRIESIDGDSAILAFSTGKIRYPLIGFGKDPSGLLINLTTSDFLAQVSKAKTSS
jgi:hypothetical protein